MTAAVRAQTHHVAPPEKVTRAVAVYEWTGDLSKPTASRLVPVSLFINGHLEDAGLYLAHPVPFALEPGDIYSVEEAGDEKGTLYVEHARNFTTGRFIADEDPVGAWFGYGAFHPLAPPKPGPPLHASAHPSVIVSSSDPNRPHLATKADSTTSSAANSKADNSASAKTPMGDDSDRPTLQRKTDATGDSTSQQTPKDSSSSTQGDTDTERPSLRKRNPENTGKKSPPTASVTGPDRSLNDDPDRPRIGRGKTDAEQDAAELKTTPPDMRQVAAVSDNAAREPHLFTREWDSAAERADVLSHMQAVARPQVVTYLTVNHLTPGLPPPATTGIAATASAVANAAPAPAGQTGLSAPAADSNAPTLRRTPGGINTNTSSAALPAAAQPPAATPAKPSVRTTARGRTTAKSTKPAPAAPLVFTAEQLTGYTLSYGGLATYIYSAQVPVSVGGPVYMTVVAQRLPTGDFQVALRSITDAAHLDRTPWMRPIDAVDPDASHRASLLFELRAKSSRQFALYRLVSAQAEQAFVSQPIE